MYSHEREPDQGTSKTAIHKVQWKLCRSFKGSTYICIYPLFLKGSLFISDYKGINEYHFEESSHCTYCKHNRVLHAVVCLHV